MSRHVTMGRLIDRSRPVSFTFNNRRLSGYAGDTLASALIANGIRMVGRSFKYHRPRGFLASGAEEPNALLGIGTGARFEPNQRATTTALHDGLAATTQNHWPSLDFDVGAINASVAKVAPVFSAGFYYKTFIAPRAAWKHVFEPVIRQAAGLGRAPTDPDPDAYEHFHWHTDVLVAGGGIAGLAAARTAAETGARVLIVEQTRAWGGRALVDDDVTIGGQPAPDWVAGQVAALAAMPNVVMRLGITAAGVYDHGYVLCNEVVDETGTGPMRHRLWRVRAGRIVTATGAIERPLTFANNDVPGVMLASAVRDYVRLWGALPGKDAVVLANNDDAYRTAIALHDAGIRVHAVLDTRDSADGALPQAVRALQIPVRAATTIAEVHGHKAVHKITTWDLAAGCAGDDIYCDLVAMSGGWSPVVHLWSHCGGKLSWDADQTLFRPDPARAPIGADGAANVIAAGTADGYLSPAAALQSGLAAGAAAVDADVPVPPLVAAPDETEAVPHWFAPSPGKLNHGTKHFVDFQNDVTAADVRLAAQEGYESVEHTKRYTTLGMATDQGKTSNITGLALLADALGKSIPEVGTTTFRPPYTPIAMGAITGPATGPLFKPIRRTPMDAWHGVSGADWEPVADWRRPYCYRRGGETRAAAVRREVLAVRGAVGLLDASTLGKIHVSGPDAGRFLDLIYTNMMSTLKPGRCRYGLMCSEQGFLFDDGVVVRLSEDAFLCHTTSGGSDRVHAWMEEWLQTEWWDLEVFTANVTEQWAQVAVAGPQAAEVIRAAGTDLDLDALKFMDWAEGTVAGCPIRVFRISFSGELSFEIATPASHGLALWEALIDAGRPFGIMPYGTEALHVLRAEMGFIMIGDETDGTVTPHDLGLSWAVSKKKDDFIGKRGLERADLTRPGRKQLVGLLTQDPRTVLADGAHAVSAVALKSPMTTIGHVTSTYLSPTLERSIAMALIEDGRNRMGEMLDFPVDDNHVIRARVVDPVFYTPETEQGQ